MKKAKEEKIDYKALYEEEHKKVVEAINVLTQNSLDRVMIHCVNAALNILEK